MNYKKIIRSRTLRIKLMYMLSFIPDRIMIKIQYRIKTGRRLDLKRPKRFTEKLQWYKLNVRDSLMIQCVDKYEVREYVKKCGLENILVPILGIYEKVEQIDFSKLPQQFVLKDTLGGGGTSVIICSNKEFLNVEEVKKTLCSWIETKKGKHPGREWVYDQKKSRILIEEYIPSDKNEGGLIDYKFFCFNGKVEFVYGIADRDMGKGAGLAIYDRDFNRLPYVRSDEKPLARIITKPENYYEMVKCAEILSSKFLHARIDLYDQKGIIRFGEITFFDGSGYMRFEPDEFDFILGEAFQMCKE